ncbi:MAG TPA: sugar ABC transporter ATP-binding protein [Planctomycetota bacterium]|nr:sugar ABC transporter ATP-binding protein [Planctomycetota bacterium]
MAPVLELSNLSKNFGGVRALSDVSFSVQTGQRHALLGENGAGKSTLIKIIAGEHLPDQGSMRLNGEPFAPRSPHDVRRAGVFVVPQELSYCANLSVAENLLLGELRAVSTAGFVKRTSMVQEAYSRLQRLGLHEIDPRRSMDSLSTGQAQAVQIAAAVSQRPKLLLLDEPTSALSRGETSQLAAILKQLREQGVTVLYVSHRMEEIFGDATLGFAACDAYSVLRDGRHVETASLTGRSMEDVVRAMIGRELSTEKFDVQPSENAPVLLVLEDLSDPTHGRFNGVSLQVRAGEILGIAGLVGSGRTELARAIVGLDRGSSGSVRLCGEPYADRSVRESQRRGLVYLTEDRKREGLVLNMSGTANWSLPFVGRFGLAGGTGLKRGAEREAARAALNGLRVKTSHPDAPVKGLSGGNQQKVLFARWLSIVPRPRVLLLDEPTRGVDVGSKAEIHRLIADTAKAGAAVIVISSDLPELLSLSSRLAVMQRGRLAGVLTRERMSAESAGQLMLGVRTK